MFAILSLFVFACGNDDEDTDDDNENDTGTEPEGDGGDDSEEGPTVGPITSECDDSKICSGLEETSDCIANFELKTTQAGFYGTYDNIGFYGYNDKTPGGEMIPEPNNVESEPAEEVKGCDKADDWVLHMSADGFTGWGAGIGMDWGGPANPDCETAEALECLEIGYADPNFLIADAEEDERCQTDGETDPVKMRCLLYGEKIKEPRDLSDYVGIGFWVLRVDEDSTTKMQVNFGIPETTRFLADPELAEEYRIESLTYEDGCSDDVGQDNMKCFDDFQAQFRFSNDNLNKWVYKEILFEKLGTKGWGLPLDYDAFPRTRSIGIKFQTTGPGEYVDFYIDDIHLIK